MDNVEDKPTETTLEDDAPALSAEMKLSVGFISETGSTIRKGAPEATSPDLSSVTAQPERVSEQRQSLSHATGRGDASEPGRAGQKEAGGESVEEPLLSCRLGQAKDGKEASVTTSNGEGAGSSTKQVLDSTNTVLSAGVGGGELGNSDASADECPVCIEPLGAPGGHGRVLLYCSHTVCQACLAEIHKRSRDSAQLHCPLCRQKTPLPGWEIRRMQEEAAAQMGGAAGVEVSLLAAPPSPSPPQRTRGLERRLETRVGTVCGCCSLPHGSALALTRLRRRGGCRYRTCLLLLYLNELSCVMLVFLPVLVLILLFTLAGKYW